MARLYQSIWDKLKLTGTAEVVVSRRHLATVKQAVKKLKCEENVRRRGQGKIGYSKMEITSECLSQAKDRWKMTFTISHGPYQL